MNRKSIGVFDSGLGGLTVVKELLKILPNENIVYFGDTGRVPYGSRSDSTILKYALQDISFLMSNDVKIIIAACGTASSIFANNNINSASFSDFYYTGVLEPTAKKAADLSQSGKIGIIGTSATINSGAYQKCLTSINSNLQITAIDCPLFVPLVENGVLSPDNIIVQSVVKMYLEKITPMKIDTLILGCTHYPLLEEAISKFMGDSVTLINPGVQTAKFVKKYLNDNKLLNDTKRRGNCSFFASDDVNNFKSIASTFLGDSDFKEFNLVSVDSISNLDTRFIR